MSKIFKESRSLAAFLRVSKPTIINWRAAGMPFRQVAIDRYEYELDAVLEWLVGRGGRYRRHVENLHKRLNRGKNGTTT